MEWRTIGPLQVYYFDQSKEESRTSSVKYIYIKLSVSLPLGSLVVVRLLSSLLTPCKYIDSHRCVDFPTPMTSASETAVN